MEAREFVSTVCNGHLEAPVRAKLADVMRRYEGKKLRITVSEAKKRRSNAQNAYYFGVVVPAIRGLFAEAGTALSSDETHEFIKRHIWKLTKQACLPDGEVIEVTDSSTKLATQEWEERMHMTRAWAAQYDVDIPEPHQEPEA